MGSSPIVRFEKDLQVRTFRCLDRRRELHAAKELLRSPRRIEVRGGLGNEMVERRPSRQTRTRLAG